MAAFDRQAACDNRLQLMEWLLARGEGRILFSGGDLQGCAMVRRFGLGHQIGPAVARHEDHALALVKALSHDLYGKFQRLDVVRDSRLDDWALQQGVLHVASVTRMVLGPAVGSRPADGPRLHALASQALG
ncbi:hypothetical protein [Fodinicurvata sediminis]|uniref:hypothetical protein n=1 Tax=Fodinicurvata sediminis TaxID=1121832 RepID=UPI00248005B4|nr:hypothetical protein [Fodinicurvata sediminis]